MLSVHGDIPLGRDAAGRFLHWIVGLMVFLAGLALAGTLASERMTQRWHLELADSLTVQVPAAADESLRRERVEASLAVLSETPGVQGARVLDDRQMSRLLEPWLGPAGLTAGLPIPDLIAVSLRQGSRVDLEALRQRLNTAAPGALVDDHREWIDDIERFARAVDIVAGVVVALVSLTAIATVVFVARTGLAIHRRIIDLLHLIGAQDDYIARQFQAQALRQSLLGGAIGTGCSLVTILALDRALQRLEPGLFPALALEARQWLVLALLPVAAAAIAMLTARVTVLRALARVL
jgi:cell division transport system permease protein